MMSDQRLSPWIAGCLFTATFCVYALFGRAEISSVDEVFVYRTCRSLAEHGSWSIEELAGRTTSRFSFVPSLWAIPFFKATDALGVSGPDAGSWLLYGTQLGSCVATALTVVLLAGWLARLGYGDAIAVGCGLLYGWASLAFAYSSTLFVQVTATLLLLWCCRAVGQMRNTTMCVAFMLTVWCRMNALLLWPAFVLAIVQSRAQRRWSAILLLSVGGACGLAADLIVHWFRADPLLAGAYAGEAFTTSLWVGMASQLVSFGKGLAWFSPLCFAGLLGLFWYASQRPQPGRLALYVVVTHLLVLSKWWTWHGGVALGPRLLLPILPLCMLPVAHWLQQWEKHSLLLRRIFTCLVAASLWAGVWAASRPLGDYFPPGPVRSRRTTFCRRARLSVSRGHGRRGFGAYRCRRASWRCAWD